MTVDTRANYAAGKYTVSYEGKPTAGGALALWKNAKRIEEAELLAMFKADLEVEHGMIGHPKADIMYSKAWEEGHGSGLYEVALCYENLVELIKHDVGPGEKIAMARLRGIVELIDASNNGKGANSPFAHQIREIATGIRAPTDY